MSEQRNERARKAAQRVGRPVYQHEIVAFHPACTTCGQPLRNVETARAGLRRVCACSDVLWRCGAAGWVRERSARRQA